MIRVGDIRKAIEGVPDDAKVYTGINGGEMLGVSDEDIDIRLTKVSSFMDGVLIEVFAVEFDDDWDDELWEGNDDEDLD